jgi:hypothetical protein
MMSPSTVTMRFSSAVSTRGHGISFLCKIRIGADALHRAERGNIKRGKGDGNADDALERIAPGEGVGLWGHMAGFGGWLLILIR